MPNSEQLQAVQISPPRENFFPSPCVDRNRFIGFDIGGILAPVLVFMSFPSLDQFLLEDDAEFADDSDDFDLDFDEDYESLSDEEFEVLIEYDEYDSNDLDIPEGEFCLDDDLDGFGDFETPEDSLAEKDYADGE